jgi:hypothetical protein
VLWADVDQHVLTGEVWFERRIGINNERAALGTSLGIQAGS